MSASTRSRTSSTRKQASSTKTSPRNSPASRSKPAATTSSARRAKTAPPKKQSARTGKRTTLPATSSTAACTQNGSQTGETQSSQASLSGQPQAPIDTIADSRPTPAQSLSPEQAFLQAQIELAQRTLAKRRLIPFTQRINPNYKAGWVHEDIARRLERFSDDVAKGLSPRLLLLMPPRHGKSELASRMFPAWHLGRHPDHEIIACSYNVSLAMSFSRKVKEVMNDPGYQTVFATRLHPDFQANEEWGIAGARGGYVAAGVGGGITGKGAHVLVIDDPIKNAEEADSADVREKLWDWYGSTAYTRLAPGGGVLIIQTWWHDDDLAGRVQLAMRDDEEADQFEVVKYPALAEDDEYIELASDTIVRRAELVLDTADQVAISLDPAACPATYRFLRRRGEALHPVRYDERKLHRIKKTIPPRFWSALYQQNPVPDDGAYFHKDWFKRCTVPHISKANVYIAWDFAITEKQASDYTVGTVMLQDDDDILHVAEVVRFKSEDAFYVVDTILNTCVRWFSKTMVVGFEDGQIFKAIKSLLAKRMRERKLYPAIQLLTPITDKKARARPLQGRMQQGMVSFSDKGEWFDALRAEFLRFPAGVHDDMVDSAAWCASLAIGKEPPRKPVVQQAKSWKDKLPVLGMARGASHMAA